MSQRNEYQAAIGLVETEHTGVNLLVHASAVDHCNMRAKQLAALLRLMSGTGLENFAGAGQETQDGVLWLASSLADEVVRMLPLVEIEAARHPGQAADTGAKGASP